MRSRLRATVPVVLVLLGLSVASASASADTVRVDANGEGGWQFNRDTSTSTPYEFSTAAEHIGAGSLFVLPITNTVNGNSDKFVAELPVGTLTSDFTSLAYWFNVASAGPTDFKHFYLNVYTTAPTSPPDKFYDCRFDFVPAGGAQNTWASNTGSATGTPTAVAQRNTSPITCPATIAAMPAGSRVRGIALSVGDTSGSDTGVSGYYDDVTLTTAAGSTTYDFEATPSNKDDCKKGGFATYGFENQGACVSRSNALAH